MIMNECTCCQMERLQDGGLLCDCSYEICMCGKCFGCCRCLAGARRPYDRETDDRINRYHVTKHDRDFLHGILVRY